MDRHQSNGVEGTNKQILRHLKALVHDERVISKWSNPAILHYIMLTINSSYNSETGYCPIEVKFGSDDLPYFRLPVNELPQHVTTEF